MSLEKCPKCGNQCLIKTPHSRIERECIGICGHIADEYYFRCLHKGCLYDSGLIRENTELGELLLLLPWYKRFFFILLH